MIPTVARQALRLRGCRSAYDFRREVWRGPAFAVAGKARVSRRRRREHGKPAIISEEHWVECLEDQK